MRQCCFVQSVVSALALSLGFTCAAGSNVLTYHNDNARLGANLNETILSLANVKASTFGKQFIYPVDGYVYAQPLYVSGLLIPGKGTHNVIFIATEHNSVYAFDADNNVAPGGLIWQVNLGAPGLSDSGDFGTRYGGPYQSITPEVGITGTPVIDLSSKTLYVDTFIHQGPGYVHKLHALDITTGAEQAFSPVIVSASVRGTGVGGTNGIITFNAQQQLQRAALTVAGGVLYIAYAGYEDTDPYHGWVIGFDPSNLQQLPAWTFNTTPNSTVGAFGVNAGEGGIWMSGCGLSEDALGNLYFGVGNGSFNAINNSHGTEYGDSFIKLSTVRGLSVSDYFTPWNQQYLADNNVDVGSSGIVLLPDQPGPFKHLMISAGKQGVAYLMNRDRMTANDNHFNTSGQSDAVVKTIFLGNGALSTAAYFNGTIYFAAVGDALRAYVLNNGVIPDAPTSMSSRTFGYPGATPSISANGDQNGIVWAVQNGNPAVLTAYDAGNVSTELYNSSQAGGRDQMPRGVKFAVPTIANGKVYVGGQYGVSVFGIFSDPSTNPPTPGHYTGLFYESGGVEFLKSGFFAATIARRGAYTGLLQMGTNRYSLNGHFDSTGSASNTIPRKNLNPLNLQLHKTQDALFGTVSDGTWTADLLANRLTFQVRTNPAPFAPKYTLIIPGPADGNPATPQGDGFGTVTNNRAGLIQITGALGDGTKFTRVAYLSQNGQWPLYVPLYGGPGQILGWLTLASSDQDDLSGQISWIKPKTSSRFYPDGFDLQPTVTGSIYRRPTAGARILNLSGASISLTDGDLSSPILEPVTLNSQNKVSGNNNLTISFNTSSGRFTGKIVNPSSGKAIVLNGVALQKQNIASGSFLGASHTGRVRIQ